MKQEFEQKLMKDFPKIFADANMSPEESAMYWGFDCGDGWFNLIYNLCAQLQFDVDNNGYPQLVANQVKEKYGTLSFLYYINLGEDVRDDQIGAIDGIVQFAEFLSASICELCGKPGKINSTGWLKTLCEECKDEGGH